VPFVRGAVKLDPRPVQTYKRTLFDEKEYLSAKKEAAQKLAKLDPQEAISTFIQVIENSISPLSEVLLELAGNIGTPEAVAFIIKALNNRTMSVRQQAISLLEKFEDERIYGALLPVICTAGESLVQEAIRVLYSKKENPLYRKEILKAVISQDPATRFGAATMLATIIDDETMRMLDLLAKSDPQEEVRKHAKFVLVCVQSRLEEDKLTAGIKLKEDKVLSLIDSFAFEKKAPLKAIDIGSGAGEFRRRINILWQGREIDIECVDSNSEAAKIGFIHYGMPILIRNAEDHIFEEKSFDIAFLNYPNPGYMKVLKLLPEAERILRDGGLFFFASSRDDYQPEEIKDILSRSHFEIIAQYNGKENIPAGYPLSQCAEQAVASGNIGPEMAYLIIARKNRTELLLGSGAVKDHLKDPGILSARQAGFYINGQLRAQFTDSISEEDAAVGDRRFPQDRLSPGPQVPDVEIIRLLSGSDTKEIDRALEIMESIHDPERVSSIVEKVFANRRLEPVFMEEDNTLAIIGENRSHKGTYEIAELQGEDPYVHFYNAWISEELRGKRILPLLLRWAAAHGSFRKFSGWRTEVDNANYMSARAWWRSGFTDIELFERESKEPVSSIEELKPSEKRYIVKARFPLWTKQAGIPNVPFDKGAVRLTCNLGNMLPGSVSTAYLAFPDPGDLRAQGKGFAECAYRILREGGEFLIYYEVPMSSAAVFLYEENIEGFVISLKKAGFIVEGPEHILSSVNYAVTIRAKKPRKEDSISAKALREKAVPILYDLGYSKGSLDPLLKELETLFKEIDARMGLARLQNELSQALQANNAARLIAPLNGLNSLFEENNYKNVYRPRPIINLLINGLNAEDIFERIMQTEIPTMLKLKANETLISCTAISQLGYTVLRSLGVDAKGAISPRHAFLGMELSGGRVLFIDFYRNIFRAVNIARYYRKEGVYFVLKEKYRLSRKELEGITERVAAVKGGERITVVESLRGNKLLHWKFFYIKMISSGGVSRLIHNNLGLAYGTLGIYNEAILACKKAIRLDPNYADAYNNLGIIYAHLGQYDKAITELRKAKKLNPNDNGIISNLDKLYGMQGGIGKTSYLAEGEPLGIDTPAVSLNKMLLGWAGRYSEDEILMLIKKAKAEKRIKNPGLKLGLRLWMAQIRTNTLLETLAKQGRIAGPPFIKGFRLIMNENNALTFGAYIKQGILYIEQPLLQDRSLEEIILHEKIEIVAKDHAIAQGLTREVLTTSLRVHTSNIRHIIGTVLKHRYFPLSIFISMIAFTALIFTYRDTIINLGVFDYRLAAFLTSAVTNATVFIPDTGLVIILSLAAAYNPVIVGIMTGLGAITALLMTYFGGRIIRSLVKGDRIDRIEQRVNHGIEKRGWLFILFAYGIPIPSPLPEITGIVAGATKFSISRFLMFIVCATAGNVIKSVFYACIGAWLLNLYGPAVLNFFKENVLIFAPLAGIAVIFIAFVAILKLVPEIKRIPAFASIDRLLTIEGIKLLFEKSGQGIRISKISVKKISIKPVRIIIKGIRIRVRPLKIKVRALRIKIKKLRIKVKRLKISIKKLIIKKGGISENREEKACPENNTERTQEKTNNQDLAIENLSNGMESMQGGKTAQIENATVISSRI